MMTDSLKAAKVRVKWTPSVLRQSNQQFTLSGVAIEVHILMLDAAP